jgi:IS30 family transposase
MPREAIVTREQMQTMQHMTNAEIARALGCHHNTVSRILSRYGMARYRKVTSHMCPCEHEAECWQRLREYRSVLCERGE